MRVGGDRLRDLESGNDAVRRVDRHMEDIQARRETQSDGFVVPGSYQWRLKRDEEKAERDRLLGEFKRFGHED